jgi:hypothetical protein
MAKGASGVHDKKATIINQNCTIIGDIDYAVTGSRSPSLYIYGHHHDPILLCCNNSRPALNGQKRESDVVIKKCSCHGIIVKERNHWSVTMAQKNDFSLLRVK